MVFWLVWEGLFLMFELIELVRSAYMGQVWTGSNATLPSYYCSHTGLVGYGEPVSVGSVWILLGGGGILQVVL